METYEIIILVLSILLVLSVVALIVFKVKNKKAKPSSAVSKVEVIDGVRYTESEETLEKGKTAISHKAGDYVLSVGKTVTAKKDSDFLPGKYAVLSSHEGTDKFMLRVGGFVREYCHGDEIVLGEGDEITATSHTVILR